MKRQFLGLLARVYVMQFAMEVPATVAMLAEMLMDYGFQVDIGSVRPLLRALQMEGYLESVLRDGIGRVYLLTELGVKSWPPAAHGSTSCIGDSTIPSPRPSPWHRRPFPHLIPDSQATLE
jgi:hypothetical protein